MNVKKRYWWRMIKICWSVISILFQPDLVSCFITMNVFQWGEKILFETLQKPLKTNGELQKMSKTSHKVTFSKLRNVETGRGDSNEKLKFLTYFWKPSLNLWVRWFLNATKSQIFSCSIQGTVWISIGKSNNFPLIIHSAQRACRVTVVFLIL